MKKMNYLVNIILVFTLCLSVTVTGYAEEAQTPDKDDINSRVRSLNDLSHIFATYYLPTAETREDMDRLNNLMNVITGLNNERTQNRDSQDNKRPLVEEGSAINYDKLIQSFTTDTANKDSLLRMCRKIRDEAKLEEFTQKDGWVYTILTNTKGQPTGELVMHADTYEFIMLGEVNDLYNPELRFTESIIKSISNSELDILKTKAKMLRIECFATGNLLYDGNNEYFIPAYNSRENTGLIIPGEMYSVTEIISIIEKNIDYIFPVYDIDEDGNPYLGGGGFNNPQTGGSPVEHSKTAPLNNAFITLSIVCFIGGVILLVISFGKSIKNRRFSKK